MSKPGIPAHLAAAAGLVLAGLVVFIPTSHTGGTREAAFVLWPVYVFFGILFYLVLMLRPRMRVLLGVRLVIFPICFNVPKALLTGLLVVCLTAVSFLVYAPEAGQQGAVVSGVAPTTAPTASPGPSPAPTPLSGSVIEIHTVQAGDSDGLIAASARERFKDTVPDIECLSGFDVAGVNGAGTLYPGDPRMVPWPECAADPVGGATEEGEGLPAALAQWTAQFLVALSAAIERPSDSTMAGLHGLALGGALDMLQNISKSWQPYIVRPVDCIDVQLNNVIASPLDSALEVWMVITVVYIPMIADSSAARVQRLDVALMLTLDSGVPLATEVIHEASGEIRPLYDTQVGCPPDS